MGAKYEELIDKAVEGYLDAAAAPPKRIAIRS
jgi:hypothetical protein